VSGCCKGVCTVVDVDEDLTRVVVNCGVKMAEVIGLTLFSADWDGFGRVIGDRSGEAKNVGENWTE